MTAKRFDPDAKKRAEELLQQFFDDELSDEEGKELLTVWDDCPDLESSAQEQYQIEAPLVFFAEWDRQPVSLDGVLAPRFFQTETQDVFDSSRMDRLVRLASESPAILKDGEPSPSFSETKLHAAPKAVLKKENERNLRRLFLLAVPCLIVYVVAVYFEFRSPSTSYAATPVARIVECVEAEWEDGSETFKPGRELEPCALKLRSGIVKIEFAGGVEVILEGPTEFLVKRRDAAFCQYGKLSANVPPGGIGFEVASPTATVVDLGTWFSMHVADGKSEVNVIKGKVEVRQSAHGNLLLTEGLAGLFELNAKTQTFAADLATFFDEMKWLERKERYVSRRQAVWEQQRERQISDPALAYRLDTNRERSPSRVSGSRDDKRALRFSNARHRVRFDVDRSCRHLTMIASVRLENLRHLCHAILVGDDYYNESGKFFWQFDRGGFFQFHVNDGGEMRRFDTPTVVGARDRNTWLNIALVADADREMISFYLDGEEVSTSAWRNPRPLRIGSATIGNEHTDQRRSSTRYFGGSIEDFWIYDRPFSSQEIKDFYVNNN